MREIIVRMEYEKICYVMDGEEAGIIEETARENVDRELRVYFSGKFRLE